MKANLRVTASMGAAFVLACLMMLFAAAIATAADSPKISGVDCYTVSNTDGKGSTIDVLLIEGNAGDTVFVEVERNGKLVASRVPFTIGSGETSRIINMTINGYVATDAYTVRAYADRANKTLLYEGTITPVMANFGSAGVHPIATQTLGAGESRVFTPTNTVYYDGVSYLLERDSAGQPIISTEGGYSAYSYIPYTPADVVEGSVTYVDDQGKTVAVKTLPVLKGSENTYPVSSVITGDDGVLYRTISCGTISPSYAGQHDFVIHVKKLSDAQAANAYVATVKFVYADDAGNTLPLATDSVTVNGPYEYSVPAVIYADDPANPGVVCAYALEDTSKQKLRFDAADPNALAAGGVTETVRYVKSELTGRFNLVNGEKRLGEQGRALGYENFTVTQDNPVATPSQQTIEIDGVTYALAGSASDYAYEYGSTRFPVIDVYYVPADYVAPGDYEVAVNYVNLADNSIITSKSYTSSSNQTADLEIESDASFEQGGESFVRLAGQEAPISHNYYSSTRTYTVYYRNEKDTLNANVTITRMRVMYEDGEVIYVDTAEDGGATVTEDGETVTAGNGGVVLFAATQNGAAGAGAGVGDGSTIPETAAGALNAARTYNAINGLNGGYITNEAGIDSNTEHIEDAANPLASGGNKKLAFVDMALPFGIGIVVTIGVIVVVTLVIRRKSRKAEEV